MTLITPWALKIGISDEMIAIIPLGPKKIPDVIVTLLYNFSPADV